MRMPRAQLWCEAIGIRAALPVMLWAWPIDRTLRALTPREPTRRDARITLPAIEDVTELITRRFRPTRTACLQRALLRYALLRRHGYEARFHIGVRPGGHADGFEAHAWVTLEEAPVMERMPLNYTPTLAWPVRDAHPPSLHAVRC